MMKTTLISNIKELHFRAISDNLYSAEYEAGRIGAPIMRALI